MFKGNLLKLQPRGLVGNFTYGLDGRRSAERSVVCWMNSYYLQLTEFGWTTQLKLYDLPNKYFGLLKTLDLVKPQSRRNIYDRPWLIKRPLVPMSSRKSQTSFFTKTLRNTSTKKRENSFFNSSKYILIPIQLF